LSQASAGSTLSWVSPWGGLSSLVVLGRPQGLRSAFKNFPLTSAPATIETRTRTFSCASITTHRRLYLLWSEDNDGRSERPPNTRGPPRRTSGSPQVVSATTFSDFSTASCSDALYNLAKQLRCIERVQSDRSPKAIRDPNKSPDHAHRFAIRNLCRCVSAGGLPHTCISTTRTHATDSILEFQSEDFHSRIT